MILFTFTEVHQITDMIEAYVGIEVCEPATAFKLGVGIIACVGFLQIVLGEEVDAWKTIRILARSIVVDVCIAVCRVFAVVLQCLIVQAHILGRTEVGGVTLGCEEAHIASCAYLQSVDLATFGGDKDCSFCSTAAIESNSTCRLEERYLADFSREHVVGITWHTVY